MNRFLFLALALLLNRFAANAQSYQMTVDGISRNYVVYAPANLGVKRPLLISCHGSNQDANYQKSQLKIEAIADTAKFVTVFPNGIDKGWELSGDRDIHFVTAIIDKMVQQYDIDRNRVYLSGFSMGGMFTYHAMNRIADKIAAFAPISGYPLWGTSYTSSRPVPILHTQGLADEVVTAGNLQGILDGWIKRNHCSTTPKVTKRYKGYNHATLSIWGGGDEGVEVGLLEFEGKGHWISNDGVLTGNEIWLFCKRYSLNLKNPSVTLTSPKNDTRFISFGDDNESPVITISANASDPDGTVVSVQFYDNETLLTTLTQAPFTYTWTTVKAGSHTIKAVVTDDEGNTGSATSMLTIETPAESFSMTTNFATQGSVPAGWETYDGNEQRIGYADGFGQGSRLFQMTGASHDFPWGLYTRNATGGTHKGYAKFASAPMNAILTLAPGTYQMSHLIANWNISSFAPVTCCVERVSDGQEIATFTSTPTANVGNSAQNSFSGTTEEHFYFTVQQGGRYAIAFYTTDGAWSDLILGGATLAKAQVNDELAKALSEFYQLMKSANELLAQTADDIYSGSQYDELTALVKRYASFESTDLTKINRAIELLSVAIANLQQHKQDVDDTEHITVVYEDNFATYGAGVLPKGWVTFDGSDKRIGEKTGLGQGARILQMTGTPRDFDYALYIRNIDGRADEGYAKFGTAESDSALALQPGKHHLTYTVCNWNRSTTEPIRCQLVRRTGNTIVYSNSVTPTCNIGNNAGNSFSGTTTVTTDIDIQHADNYVLEFYTTDAGWADAIIANIRLTRSDYIPVAVQGIPTQQPNAWVYDLQGRRVSVNAVLPKGVYILNGKKIILR